MRKFSVVSIIAATAAATMILTGSAQAIWGGGKVDSAPWAAQVYHPDDGPDLHGFVCSGSIIAPNWVLTARHCLDVNPVPMHVKVGDVQRGAGIDAVVDRQEFTSNADIALLHLKTPVQTTYLTLADSDPAVGDINQIYGWGWTEDPGPPDEKWASPVLKTADVQVKGKGADFYGGVAIKTTGVTGSARQGDSGGPQLANGVQVGVLPTQERTDDDDPVRVTNHYVSVATYRDWIRQISGV